jgi:bacterioferritin-associated ferredoxin
MIVCVCHRVSDRDIAREARAGCGSFEELQDELRVGTGCGACLDHAQATFSQHCAGRHGACATTCHAWPAGQAPHQRDVQRATTPIAVMAVA